MQATLDLVTANWLLFVIVLVVGFLLGWLITGLPSSRRRTKLEQQLSDQQRALADKEKALETATGERESLQRRLLQEEQTRTEREDRIAAIEAQLNEAQVDKEQLRSVLSERELELSKATAQLAGPVHLLREAAGVPAEAISLDMLTPFKAPAVVNAILGAMRPHIVTTVQDLASIRGFGKTSEQRLYDARIGTYWEVANLTDEAMEEILQPSPAQRAQLKYDEVRASALALAQKTDATGAIWLATKVDDLELIPGISSTFEQRLYDAGIKTYVELAAATAAQLAEICHAPATMTPNYPEWIAKAKELSADGSATTEE